MYDVCAHCVILQEAFPARFKSCHMIRQPWYLSILYKLAKPFLKQKFKDRVSLVAVSQFPHVPSPQIHMHGQDMESLHNHFLQSQLPADFGGPLPPLSSVSLLQLVAKLSV